MAEGLDSSSFLTMGLTTAGVVAVGFGLGWLLDSLLDTSPIFVIVGLLLGLAGAVSYMIVKFRTYLHPDPPPDSRPDAPR